MRKIDALITASLAMAAVLLLDHFRIHGYWYDAHDLLLKTDSGLGFDSHEFFVMTAAAAAMVLAVFRTAKRRGQRPRAPGKEL